jgi:hypothetical protein
MNRYSRTVTQPKDQGASQVRKIRHLIRFEKAHKDVLGNALRH